MRCYATSAGVFVFFVLAQFANAQGTVSFDTGQPMSPAAGKINGSGSYTLDAGYSFLEVSMVAYQLKNGGQGGYVATTVNQCAKSFSGQIVGLPAASYEVFARLRVLKGGVRYYIDTPKTTVAVAAAGGCEVDASAVSAEKPPQIRARTPACR